PAGNDQTEIVEVGRDVEGEAMAGDPAGNPNPDGRQLFGAHPDAGESLDPAGRHAVVGGSPNQHLLEVAHVAVHVAPLRLQVEDRIADDFPGTVVGDVAAASRFVDLDAAPRQRIVGRENVRT